jgi:protein O-mannosyl-transferase
MGKRHARKKVAGNRASTKVTTASEGVQRSPSWFCRDWLWGLTLILFVILAYIPVWKAGFVWDDATILTANPCIVGPLGLKEIWTTSAAGICPLTLTTFWVEHALWGLNPLPYHLVNVLIQGLNAVLLWRVLRSLRVHGAWLSAALWAIHPVAVESVAWITEMKNTESGFFFLLSILFFVRWVRAKELNGQIRGGWNYTLSLLFATLALAAKSSTVILPVVLCLCAWWMEGRLSWRNVARTVPIFLMAIAASTLSIWTQGLQLTSTVDPQWVRTWPERLAGAATAVWFYLGKLLWPHPLITIYPRWQIDAGQWVSYLALLALIVILSILWLKRWPWSRACFFAFAYFLAALLPVLGLIDNSIFRLSLVFDHLQYLASIGPLALAGAGLARLSDFVIPKNPALRSSLCVCLLLILGMATWQRTLAYKSDETFWTDTLAKNPDCWIGHNNLGNVLFQNGHVDEAIAQCQWALEIKPNYAEAHYLIGLALFQRGQVDDAVAHYQKAVEINPNYAEALSNLGLALFQKGQVDDAVAHYQKAVEITPNYVAAHYNLGNALFQKGQLDEAIDQFQKVVEIKPGAEARFNLGNALLQKGRLDEAADQFLKALEMNPDSLQTHYNLGVALAQKGELDESMTQFREVLRLNPDVSPAQDALEKVQTFVREREGDK